jgi:hypothetical protein
MHKFIFYFVALLFLTGLIVGCVQPPEYPIEPVIEFKSISPQIALQEPFYTRPDTVYTDIYFTFTDGDGDIGSDDSTLNVTIIDERVPNVPYKFQLPKVDPGGAGNGISGEVLCRLPPNCCIPDPVNGIPRPPCDTTDNNDQLRDTVIYTIQISDRAGHMSNIVKTAPLVLICKQ